MSVAAPDSRTASVARRGIGRRAATAGLLVVLLGSLMLAVPALRPVVLEVREMNPWWITAAVALELASGLSYVVVFRLFFDRVAAPDARALAWTSMASGVLLPGGGVGGLAIGGWLMRLTGAPTRWIVRRSSGIFFLTSAVNGAAIIAAGMLLLGGGAGPHDFARAALPLLAAALIAVLIAATPWAVPRLGARTALHRLDGIVAGIRDAEQAARRPSWRLAGALGYLGFDIAVLWATFSAVGDPPPAAALVLGRSWRRGRAGRRSGRRAAALRRRAGCRRGGGARLPRDRALDPGHRRTARLRPPASTTRTAAGGPVQHARPRRLRVLTERLLT
jgi:hypothetical protein